MILYELRGTGGVLGGTVLPGVALPGYHSEVSVPNLYPLKDMSLSLKGTPIDILTTLRMSFPALLDKDKTYRFTIKVDDYVL